MRGPRYEKHTWPEIREIAREGRVLLLPIGAVEQHGPHLPLDTDSLLVNELSIRVAETLSDIAVSMPPIYYGFSPHHIDFPGSIGIDAQPFIDYILCVVRCALHHGFSRVLLVNGHDSNTPMLSIVARTICMETDALCGVLQVWGVIRKMQSDLPFLDFPRPDHGGEKETSMYLALDESSPNMELAPDRKETERRTEWHDFYDASILNVVEWFSTYTETGIMGDASVASKEKGEQLFEVAVPAIAEVVKRFYERPRRSRVDHH